MTILSAGLRAAGFALALGGRLGITVTGWRSGTVAAVFLVGQLINLPEEFVNLGCQCLVLFHFSI